MIAITLLLFAIAPDNAGRCDLPPTMSRGELFNQLALRAAHAVERAGQPGWKNDAALALSISPDAEVGFGVGDVGIPLAKGAAGLRQLSQSLKANQYRFRQFGAIPMQIDSCAEYKMDMEFVGDGNASSVIQFTFRNGRIVSAAGWAGSVATGSLKIAVGEPEL